MTASSAIVLMSTIGLAVFSATVSRHNSELTAANQREIAEREKAIAESKKAQAAESVATEQKELANTALDDLIDQTKEASEALLHYGLSEYRSGRLASSTEILIRAWKLRSVGDPLKASYSRVVSDVLTRGGRSWVVLSHDGHVTSVAFSPDGSRLATASSDKTARIWNAYTHPLRRPVTSLEKTIDGLRIKIARNLDIDPQRVRYFDPGEPSSIGVRGERWQIHYRDDWRDLPWHHDGPLYVTRELVRRWLGVAESKGEPPLVVRTDMS
jgi:WD domain, G-beta repeat